MKYQIISIFALAIFFTACNKNTCDQDIYSINTFEANKNYCVDDLHNLTIRMVSDSRCPLYHNCVNAGWVDVHLEWKKDDNLVSTDSIRFHNDGIVTYEKLGFDKTNSITINAIHPYPIDIPIPIGNYQFKFEFKK
jgi:hypothetical protein